jgi:hypothetical protein
MISNDDRLHPVTLEGARTPALLALVWRSPESPAVKKLLDQCQRSFGL